MEEVLVGLAEVALRIRLQREQLLEEPAGRLRRCRLGGVTRSRLPFALFLAVSLQAPALAVEGGYPATGEPVHGHSASSAAHAPAGHEKPPAAHGHGAKSGHKKGKSHHKARKGHGPAKKAAHEASGAGGATAGHSPSAHGSAPAKLISVPARQAGDPHPDQYLTRLLEGNKRYLAAEFVHPYALSERRAEVAKGQHPYVAILGCADSRVPPEIVFDQNLGDLFVIRVAGNIANPHVLGSLEYAVEHLGSVLIVVLGHERCGAVRASLSGGHAAGHVGSLVTAIKPAVDLAAKTRPAGEDAYLDLAVRTNVKWVAKGLTEASPILAAYVKAGRLKIQGARYDLDTGEVSLVN
jgi:carbonic anhydrase